MSRPLNLPYTQERALKFLRTKKEQWIAPWALPLKSFPTAQSAEKILTSLYKAGYADQDTRGRFRARFRRRLSVPTISGSKADELCIVCKKKLSQEEILAEVQMGNTNCTCWQDKVLGMRKSKYEIFQREVRRKVSLADLPEQERDAMFRNWLIMRESNKGRRHRDHICL